MEVISNMKSALEPHGLRRRTRRQVSLTHCGAVLPKHSLKEVSRCSGSRDAHSVRRFGQPIERKTCGSRRQSLTEIERERIGLPGNALVHLPTHGSGPVGCGRTGSSQRTGYSPSRGLRGVQVEMESAEHKRSERRSERKDKGLQGRERLLEKGRHKKEDTKDKRGKGQDKK